jgi:hypothetical protein
MIFVVLFLTVYWQVQPSLIRGLMCFFLPRLEQERVFQLYRQCGGQSQCRKVSKIELLLLVEFIDHRCLC